MQLLKLKLVTIVAERILQPMIIDKIHELGATGCTWSDAQGQGARGTRQDPVSGENVRIEVVCSAGKAEAILTFVSHHYFEYYACIGWISDVEVVRGAHYAEKP